MPPLVSDFGFTFIFLITNQESTFSILIFRSEVKGTESICFFVVRNINYLNVVIKPSQKHFKVS
jgi:hypothetical protein